MTRVDKMKRLGKANMLLGVVSIPVFALILVLAKDLVLGGGSGSQCDLEGRKSTFIGLISLEMPGERWGWVI